jgi:hypothetical protein
MLQVDSALARSHAANTLRTRGDLESSAGPPQRKYTSVKGPPPQLLFGSVFVGMPPQEFDVAFDTSSGNILLPGRACLSNACLAHRTYDAAVSATAQPMARVDQGENYAPLKGNCPGNVLDTLQGLSIMHCADRCDEMKDCVGFSYRAKWNGGSCAVKKAGCDEPIIDGWTYYPKNKEAEVGREVVKLRVGTGTASGMLVRDKVCLSGEENLCALTAFVDAVEMSDAPFGIFPYDGIVGLGLPGASLERRFNFMGNLAEEGSLASDRFAVWLANGLDKEDSEITFGAASDARIASEDTVWLKLSTVKTGMWQVTAKDLYVGTSLTRRPLGLCGEVGCQAILDTGSNVIGVPGATIEAILASLGIQEDCSNYDALPMLGFHFGDYVLNIGPADYIERTTDGCYHRFMTLEVPPPRGPIIILGAPFLKRFYTVFDRDALQVGLSVAKHAEEPNGKTSEEVAKRFIINLVAKDAPKGGSLTPSAVTDGVNNLLNSVLSVRN